MGEAKRRKEAGTMPEKTIKPMPKTRMRGGYVSGYGGGVSSLLALSLLSSYPKLPKQ